MLIRKATGADLEAVARIYEEIHQAEERGTVTTGWVRGVYPTEETAQAALRRDDLFVLEDDGAVVGAASINQLQPEAYANAPWRSAAPEQVCVLHTLAVSPRSAGQGFGKQFVAFYEAYAQRRGCTALRMDTNARNAAARAMYQKLGYREIAVVPTDFNGIPDIRLVLLEKPIG